MRLLVLLIFLIQSAFAQSKKELTSQIDSYMQNVAVKDGFSGTAVVKHHGQIVLEKGYGFSNREQSLLNTPDKIYNLGSTGMIFTEMAIMQLKDQQKLSLDNAICKYLKDCPAAWQPITIRHLLEQKSGIRSYVSLPEFEKDLGRKIDKKEMMITMASMPLEFTPGEKFNASSSNYFILGLIVEKVSGTSLSAFINKNIFTSLGMRQTRIIDKGTLKEAVTGYMVDGQSVQPAPYVDPSVMFGYANLYGTAGDLLRWEKMLYGNKLISEASLQEIHNWNTAAGYGDVKQEMFGKLYTRYFKGTWGHRMHMLRFPSDSTVILLLSNNNSTKQDKFMRDIASMIYGIYTPPREIKEVAVPLTVLQRYLGNYQFAPGREVAITIDNNKLYMQGTGRPRRNLVAVSETKFFIKGSEVYLQFPQGNGVVNQLVLHEINTTITATRFQ